MLVAWCGMTFFVVQNDFNNGNSNVIETSQHPSLTLFSPNKKKTTTTHEETKKLGKTNEEARTPAG